MGWVRLVLVCWAILGAVSGVELAWVRHNQSPQAVTVFTDASRTELHFYQRDFGLHLVPKKLTYHAPSADQKGLLYSSPTDGTIKELRTDNTRRTILPLPSDYPAYQSTSPDGKWYLFTSSTTAYVARTDGSHYYPIASPNRDAFDFATWSHDNQWLIWQEKTDTTTILYRVHLPDGEPQKIAEGIFLALSPDDQWIFMEEPLHRSHLYRVRVDGSGYEVLALYAGDIQILQIDEALQWMTYYISGGQSRIYSIDLTTPVSKHLVKLFAVPSVEIAIHPTHPELIVYSQRQLDHGYEIRLINPQDGTEETLLSGIPDQIDFLIWLGEDVLIYGRFNDYFLLDLASDTSIPLDLPNRDNYRFLELSHDQQYLWAWSNDPQNIGYWEIARKTGQAKFIADTPTHLKRRGDLLLVGRQWHPLGWLVGIWGTSLLLGILQWKRVQHNDGLRQ